MSRRIWIALILVLGLVMPALAASGEDGTPPAAAGEKLFLEVFINGHSSGKIAEFTLRNGDLLASSEDLHDLGVRVPQSAPTHRGGLISLSDIPGLRWTIDQKSQEIHFDATEDALIPAVLQSPGRQTTEAHRTVESGTGLTLNYDVLSTFASADAGATGAFDMRAFSPHGIVSSEWLTNMGTSAQGNQSAIRLDTAYSFADVNTLRRYVAGDFITGALAWTRPVHMEGFQIRKDFSMRPDLVTFPMPSIKGSAAVPSTVSVLADGNLVLSSSVAAGPFEVPQLPVVTGAGTISMTMTNALGQQVNINQPFYASSFMLAPGLHSFAIQGGMVRRSWGSQSYDYGKIAAAGMFRTGITSKFTFESSAEATPGATMAGAGGVVQIANLGVLNFALAGSGGADLLGGQLSAGAQRIGRQFSVGASAILATRNYRDIAAVNGSGIPRKQISGFTSVSLRHLGSAGVAFAGIDQNSSSGSIPFTTSTAEHSRVLSADYSIVVHHMAVYAGGFKDFGTPNSSTGLQAGVTVSFGRRSSADLGVNSQGDVQIHAQQPAVTVGQWGYNAYVSGGNSNHQFAQAEYKSPIGRFVAGIDSNAGELTYRTESQGAFSLVDGSIFPSNQIFDSFAIIDTGPMHHVRVFQENREVGFTNSSGRLLVPDMRSFDVNHITIAATDIPADTAINDSARILRPQDRSGVVVKFPIVVSHGALLKLVDESSAPIPLGSAAKLGTSQTAAPVGYDGETYLEGLSPHNRLTVLRPDGRQCTVEFDYQPVPGEIPSIGPLRCVLSQP